MRKCIIAILLLLSPTLFAQDAWVTTGGYMENATGSVSYSVGLLHYVSKSNTNGLLIEGMQQPLTEIGDPLPITLLYFKVATEQSPNKALLSWATVSEVNSDKFIIERSSDALIFTQLLEKPAAGNTQEKIEYKAMDNNPLLGKSFYRLKQMDMDGSFTYSIVVPVQFSENFDIVAAPNPATDFVQLLFKGDIPDSLKYYVTDMNGRQVLSGSVTSSATSVQLNGLSAGTYVLNVSQDGKLIKSFKIIKQN